MKEIAEYVGRKYDHGADIRATLENRERYEPTKPKDLGEKAQELTEKRIWEQEVDEYVKQKAKLTENMRKRFLSSTDSAPNTSAPSFRRSQSGRTSSRITMCSP